MSIRSDKSDNRRVSMTDVRRLAMKTSANLHAAQSAIVELLSMVESDEVKELVIAVTALRAIANSSPTSTDPRYLRGIAVGALERMKVELKIKQKTGKVHE